MTARQNTTDLIVGMKAICQALGVSESTALKWHRENGLPIKKSSKGGNAGIWLASRTKLNDWIGEYVG